MEESKPKYTPILPFDVTYGEDLSMYDNFPYQKDVSLLVEGSVRMESGNVYKFYRCAETESKKLKNENPSSINEKL